MGTLVRIVLYAPDEEIAKAAARAAYDEIAAIEAVMSDYKPESELSRLREGAQTASPMLFEVLQASQHYASLSDGAFDVTTGPVIRLWRRARKEKKLPDPAELRETLARVGWKSLVLGTSGRTVKLSKPGMLLDLGGIAKGYACDRALASLREHGIPSALVDTGGGMAMGDPPPDRPHWKVKLADEEDAMIHASRCGISTSGDLHQFLEVEGVRYSHIVDPKTGMGLATRALVTVIAPDGMSADALSTSISVMGPERGLKLAEELPTVEARMRWVEGEATKRSETRGFAPYLRP